MKFSNPSYRHSPQKPEIQYKKKTRKRYETDIISDVRLLRLTKERNARISLRRENINESIRVTVERDGGRRFEKLSIDCAENSDIVIGSGGGSDDAVVLIDHLHELANNERHRLDPLHFFLRAKKLALEILLLVLDVLFLDVDEFELALERFEAAVEVVFIGGGGVAAEGALEVVGF